MCTVTYINNNGSRYFTSNRDENQSRPAPVTVETLQVNGMSITFPKDPVAGGTWFAATSNACVAILLNGAFEKHVPQYPYKKSRGLVLLDLASAFPLNTAFAKMVLEDIEPFTIVHSEMGKLTEIIWDGDKKHIRSLDPSCNYIWSSVTLYDKAAIYKRKNLFQQFIDDADNIHERSILDFHSNNYDDPENGFIIRRKNGIKTQSITQAILTDENIRINYYDLDDNAPIKKLIALKEMTNESH